jgi:hypothetical protein
VRSDNAQAVQHHGTEAVTRARPFAGAAGAGTQGLADRAQNVDLHRRENIDRPEEPRPLKIKSELEGERSRHEIDATGHVEDFIPKDCRIRCSRQ